MDIVNLSEMDPDWNWLSTVAVHTEPLRWQHASTKSVSVPAGMPKPESYRRIAAAHRAASLVEDSSALLVSHGPRMTMYGALAMAARFRVRRHLAYAFNFTELPRGPMRAVMSRAFKRVDRFVCFSTMEKELYADHFGLDIARFDMIHWAARPPAVAEARDGSLPERYLCAIGSQGRDYETLLNAMTRLPDVRLVLVATPESLGGRDIPPNVDLRCNIPPRQAMSILQGALFNVVPLIGTEVPCGHVTLVAAMHCQKASIVSDSSGVADYIQDGVNGLTVDPRDAAELAAAISRLWHDPALTARLGTSAGQFAQQRCGEGAAVHFLERFLRTSPMPAAG